MNVIACRGCASYGDPDDCMSHYCATRGESWLLDILHAERLAAIKLASDQTRALREASDTVRTLRGLIGK